MAVRYDGVTDRIGKGEAYIPKGQVCVQEDPARAEIDNAALDGDGSFDDPGGVPLAAAGVYMTGPA